MSTPTAHPPSLATLSLIKSIYPDTARLHALTQYSLQRDAASHAELEDSLRSISRRFERFPLKGRALDLYTNNRVYLLTNKETVTVPSTLLGWRVAGSQGQVQAWVNTVQYLPAAGVGALDIRKLFGFLVYGAVLVDSYEKWPKLCASAILGKNLGIVYARTLHKIVDRLAGVGMDRMHSDQVKYAFAKYMLVHMLQRTPNEGTDLLAREATAGSANSALADFEAGIATQAKVANQAELYSLGFLEFVDAMAQSTPWLQRVTARTFIQNVGMLYDPAIMLGLEDASYFLAILATHEAGAELVKSFSFDPVYGREGDTIIDEYTRLVR